MSARNHRGKLLRISSEDKQTGQTNANFSVNLGNSAYVQSVKSCAVKSVSFKHVFPNIFDGNNTLKVQYNSVDYEFTIPVGWYGSNDLISVINGLFVAEVGITSVIMSLVVDPLGSSASQNSKFNFVSDQQFKVYSKKNGCTLSDVLGLETEQTGLNITMQWLPDLGGLSSVYLCSNEIAGDNSSASSGGGEIINVITEIPINVAFGGEISYRANDADLETIMYQNARQLTTVSLSLCTRSGAILNLQQNDLTCLFRIVPQGSYSMD